MSKSGIKNGQVLLRKRKRKIPAAFSPQKALVIYAKLNGQPDTSTRIVGLTLDEFLSNCTQQLKLTSAARKLYLTDGTLVQSIDHLQNHPEVFVSQGEPFVDTMKLLKDSVAAREMSFWGLNGIYLPKLKSRNSSSNREINRSNKVRRVFVFGNGDYFLSDGFEVISDLKNMEEFKSLCDAKHSFNGHCKRIFSSKGTEIMELSTLLDDESYVWNPNSLGSVLGPVWVTSRDDIDGSAIYNYFRQVTDSILQLLKKEKSYLSELNAMSNGNLNKVYTSSIKSFSKKELKIRRKDSEEKVTKLENDRDRFQCHLDSLSEGSGKETNTEVGKSENHYAKVTQGLRLKVYTNGQSDEKTVDFYFNVEQAKKGINDKSILFNRLLDDLSKNVHLTKSNDHSRGILVRRLFTNDGLEIKDVSTLTFDQVVCVSHGENWIDSKSWCVSGNIHFMNEDLQEQSGDLDNLKNFEVSKKMSEKQLLYNLPVLQNKKSSRSYLMISVFIKEKIANASSFETWLFTRNGRIYLKQFPSLSLTLFKDGINTIIIPATLSKSKEKVELSEITCYTVQLYPFQSGNPYQLWEFTRDGHLCCKGFPTLYLTYLPISSIASHDSFFDIITNTNIYATELLPDPSDSNQRWGFKHLDQWKLCDMPNIDWHKAALIWPLKSDGTLNDDLKWPLEGNLIPCAPITTSFKHFSDTRFPIKLNVLKNNDHRNEKAVLVTGPDLTKLVRIHRKDKYETHCSNESLLRQEFEMFLANCTGSLGLPSAARRLFTKTGKELLTLEGVSNNEYVCVSMGELWCSPEKMLTKIQLRSYTNKLTVDVERLKNFINVYSPNSEFVLGIRNTLTDEDSILEVQLLNDLSIKELQRIEDEDHRVVIIETVQEPPKDEGPTYRSVHEKTCDAAKLRYSKNNDCSHDTEEVYIKESRKSSEAIVCLNVQQFLYENNYILVSSNPKFGLYANDVGKNVSFKKIPHTTENSQYKWIVHKSGIIESVYYRGFVLTVACPRMLPFQDKTTSEYNGSSIILDKAVNTKYGNAVQRFNIVSRSGLIYPFSTNQIDKGITSAILSSICSRFVSSKAINQQGYIVEMKKNGGTGSKNLPICMSCVSILNGRYPITPMDNLRETFICSYSGGFKVLRNVDLSLENAEATYQFYLTKLHNMKEELVIKPCKNRITAAPTRNIKVLLYRNGHGRLNSPNTVTAKSIIQIMEIATNLFNLQRPVRILYTETGAAIVDELSFSNVMCNDDVNTTTKEPNIPILEGDEKDEKDEILKVNLSDDGGYFTVVLGDRPPTTLYSIEIFISSISGINQFNNEHRFPNLYFLLNYEIFNNQINTDLFRVDSDLDSEVTELTIKSSKVALQRLFNEDLSVLRMQLISATVISTSTGDEDMKLDIKSINAFADVSLNKIAERVSKISEGILTETLVCPLISTDNFAPTSATITVEVSVKMLNEKVYKTEDDYHSIESESIIMKPNYVPSNEPIELWASIGESFYFPSENDGKSPRKTKTDQLKLEIYNKKFLLRNLKGERIKKLDAGTLEATGDGSNPVMIKGNWMFPSNQEKALTGQIEILEKLLSEKKAQNAITSAPLVSGSLYAQKHMKNCLVYLNGDNATNAVSTWGETVYDLMHNAAGLLKMKKTPKYLFKNDGQLVTRIEEITPDMRLAVSHHSTFMSAENTRLQCEIKANWGRARSKYGEESTEIQVQHRPITVIDIDPFEPPDMMKPREAIAKDSKTFKVFVNGQASSSAVTICGNSFPSVLKKTAEVLELSVAVKCFYTLDGKRIINFKEILNDDILAASVTGKGFFKNEDD